jgi:hypothetical protein
VVLILDCVAALDGTSGAVSVSTTLSGGSGHEGEEGGSNKDGFGVHGCCDEIEEEGTRRCGKLEV